MSDHGEVATPGSTGSPAETPVERRFDYDRTVALSDGVFAIALTLLVLNISAPVLGPGHEGVLGGRLLDHGQEYFSYALGFAVIGLLWIRHHIFFRGIDHIDTGLTVINLVYLGLVAFLPFPTRILGLYGQEPAAVVLYATTVALVSVVARIMVVHAMRAGLLSDAGRREVRRRQHWVIVPIVFLVSIPISFVSTSAALYCWALLLVLPIVFRRVAART
ncbi:MAG TPA: TMEM175 family protein [Acidimicrobiales bacterium]|jgi:uncharacterized membrane protein|nr:TMEM175 family protein [Acidimicrobiales bacterium]